MTRKITGLVLLLLCLAFAGYSQPDRLSETDVTRQGLYIEANQQRLLGNYAKAIKLFEDLLVEEADNAALNYELARTYEAADQLQRAIDQAKKAVEADPVNQWFSVYLADLYQKTGQDNAAAGVYEKMVKAYPDKEDFYYKWAYFLVRGNKSSQALKVYEEMEGQFGMSEELTRRKHTLYLGVGDFKKAEKELINLAEAFPQNTEYLHLLAGFYDQMQEPDKAQEAYRKILDIDPNDSKAAVAIARRDNPSGDDINYLRSLQAVFVRQDVELDVKMVQLIPYIQKVADTGNADLARAALDLTGLLDQVHPGEAKVYAAKGDLYYYSDQKEEALEQYELAVAEDESIFQVWEQLVYTCYELGQYDKMLEYSEDALDVFPNKASLFYINGMGYYLTDQAASAIPSLEQALMMTGRNLPLRYQVYHLLGKSFRQLEKFERSHDAFSRALELNPNEAELLNDYSYMLTQKGSDLPKAKEMAARANELEPNIPAYQHTYGWVLYRLQEYKAAKEWIATALEQIPDDPVVIEHYGDVLFQLGETDSAIGYWEMAAEKGGSSGLLERKIADGKLYE